MDCATNARVHAAPTDVGHRPVDVFVSRLTLVTQQGDRGHDLSRLAVAALRYVLLDPRDLNGMSLFLAGKPLDGDDVEFRDLTQSQPARPYHLPVEVNSASPALGNAAPVLGSRETKVIPEYPEQRGLEVSLDLVCLAVHVQSDHRGKS